jgi:magnesium chelatase accessory protein
MSERLVWERDGRDWPHRERSRFIEAAGLRWHVQHWLQPDQPHQRVLLVHGTGSSTHSWRGLAPLLAQHAQVIAMDLPGHAFTGMPSGGAASAQLSLPGMAEAVAGLLQTLDVRPTLVIGHSAGAAVAVRMALDARVQPRAIMGLNAALLPLRGLAGQLFSPVAKLMASSSLVPRFFSARAAEPAVLARLLASTGSTLDAEGMALYGRLVSSAGHAAGALGMMANWDLQTLAHQLSRLQSPLDLVVGARDHTVPPAQAQRVLARLPAGLPSSLTQLPGLGHLAHEEQPEQVAELVIKRYFSPV